MEHNPFPTTWEKKINTSLDPSDDHSESDNIRRTNQPPIYTDHCSDHPSSTEYTNGIIHRLSHQGFKLVCFSSSELKEPMVTRRPSLL